LPLLIALMLSCKVDALREYPNGNIVAPQQHTTIEATHRWCLSASVHHISVCMGWFYHNCELLRRPVPRHRRPLNHRISDCGILNSDIQESIMAQLTSQRPMWTAFTLQLMISLDFAMKCPLSKSNMLSATYH
jgi:hypothetical protein